MIQNICITFIIINLLFLDFILLVSILLGGDNEDE